MEGLAEVSAIPSGKYGMLSIPELLLDPKFNTTASTLKPVTFQALLTRDKKEVEEVCKNTIH